MSEEAVLVHATSIAFDGYAALLRGPSGSGKSDLALRLIDAGARLVSDDQTRIWRENEALMVRAPQPIAGLLEVRGIGIVRVEALPQARLALLVDLVAPQHVERMPEPRKETIFGIALLRVALAPFEASALVKLRLALATAIGGGTVAPSPR